MRHVLTSCDGEYVNRNGGALFCAAACIAMCAAVTAEGPDGCEPHWDNTIGQPGFDDGVLALIAADAQGGAESTLYAGGLFSGVDGGGADFIAYRPNHDAGWIELGGGVNGGVRNLLLFDFDAGPGEQPTSLYVSGMFTMAGAVEANRIARWDLQSEQWSPLGSGIDGPVRVLIAFDPEGPSDGPAVYAGGLFTSAGGVPANNIAKWDGRKWAALGDGVSGMVAAVAVFDPGDGSGPGLYVGGSFSTAGGIEANNIARWDGEQWSALGSGTNNVVRSLAVFDDGSGSGPALYVGGRFTAAGGSPASYIARWDGSNWSPLGTGMNDWVAVLHVFDDGTGPNLYAGGLFTEAGSVPAASIARWSGEERGFASLGNGANASIIDLAAGIDNTGEPALFVGGWFTTMDDIPAGRIATWRAPIAADGDLDCDGTVGVADLLLLLAAWGECSDDAGSCPADLDGDGAVGVQDLLILLANWG